MDLVFIQILYTLEFILTAKSLKSKPESDNFVVLRTKNLYY